VICLAERAKDMKKRKIKILWGVSHGVHCAPPIHRSLSENETYDGVVRLPWSLIMTSTRLFCHTPTQLQKEN
jgi:hypothetical protein